MVTESLDVSTGKVKVFGIVISCQNQVPHCTPPSEKKRGGVRTKNRPHAKPDKLGRGPHGGPTNSETESNHMGGSEHKNS